MGAKSGVLSEGSHGHPACLHQSNHSSWPQSPTTHKSAKTFWPSCFYFFFVAIFTCLHLQVACCKLSFFLLFSCCLFDPMFDLISNWRLPHQGRATHIHHGCCRPESWWFKTWGVLAARLTDSAASSLHSPTAAIASHSCFPAKTPASRQKEALKNSHIDRWWIQIFNLI